jgi:hypothetical protein
MGETSKLEPSFELVGDVEEAPPFQMPGHIKEGLTGSIFGIADVSIRKLPPAKPLIDTEEASTEEASSGFLGTIVEASTGAVSPFEVLGSVVDLSRAVSSFKVLGQVADAALREPVFPDPPNDIEEPPREVSPLAKPLVGLLEEDSESGAGIEDEERGRVRRFSFGGRIHCLDMLGRVSRSSMVVVPCKLVFECEDLTLN